MIVKTNQLTDMQKRAFREVERSCEVRRPEMMGNWYRYNKQLPCFLLYERDGHVLGTLVIDNTDPAEAEIRALVLPGYRRQGVFTELLAEARAECERAGIGTVKLMCNDDSADGLAVVSKWGLSRVDSDRYLVLREPRISDRPTDAVFSRAYADMADTLAEVDAAAFGEDDATIGKSIFAGVLSNPDARLYMGCVGGVPVCSCCCDQNDGKWHLFAVSVLPAYQHRGYGRAMLSHVLRELIPDGHEISICVDPNNDPAGHLYESLGFCECLTTGYYK